LNCRPLSRDIRPAMAAGALQKLWSMDDVVKVVEEWEAANG